MDLCVYGDYEIQKYALRYRYLIFTAMFFEGIPDFP